MNVSLANELPIGCDCQHTRFYIIFLPKHLIYIVQNVFIPRELANMQTLNLIDPRMCLGNTHRIRHQILAKLYIYIYVGVYPSLASAWRIYMCLQAYSTHVSDAQTQHWLKYTNVKWGLHEQNITRRNGLNAKCIYLYGALSTSN